MNTNVSGAGSMPISTDYLAVTCLTDGIFLIGLLDSGVTIFSQQIRALNLIWALDRANRLRSASAIAVVGGGIAGLTAAMALREIFSLTFVFRLVQAFRKIWSEPRASFPMCFRCCGIQDTISFADRLIQDGQLEPARAA